VYDRILVPLDGSDLAEAALPYAEGLAGKLGSTIILVFVSEPAGDQYHHMHQSYLQKVAEATTLGAERYLANPEEKAIKVKSEILIGNPAEEIVDYAEEEDIGLVVMATHGRSGIRRWALGSVADRVVRATTRPVALIRAKDAHPDVREEGILNRILIPLDGSKESEAIIPYIEELASKLKAEVILLRVLEPSYCTCAYDGYSAVMYTQDWMESMRASAKEYLEKLGAQFEQRGLKTKSEVRIGLVSLEIIRFADEIRADLVAMSTHGRAGIGRLAFQSAADIVVREGNMPVLLVRASD